METRDDVYDLQGTLSNLLLLKIAFDAGVNMDALSNYHVIHQWSDDNASSIFLESICQLVEQYETYHNENKESEEQIRYWFEQAGYESQLYDSSDVIVLLDDKIQPFERTSFGGNYTVNGWYTGFGEIYPLDKGILIVYDESDGAVEWADPLLIITEEILSKNEKDKESEKYEMAV